MSHAGPTSARQAQMTAKSHQIPAGLMMSRFGLAPAHETGFNGQWRVTWHAASGGAPVKVVAALQHRVLQRRRPSVAAAARAVAIPDAVGALLPAPRVLLQQLHQHISHGWAAVMQIALKVRGLAQNLCSAQRAARLHALMRRSELRAPVCTLATVLA